MLRVVDDVIAMHGLLWPDEIRRPEGVAPETPVTVRDAELDLADALMDTLGSVDIGELHDDYRTAVEELIAAKAEGAVAPQEPGPETGRPGHRLDGGAGEQRPRGPRGPRRGGGRGGGGAGSRGVGHGPALPLPQDAPARPGRAQGGGRQEVGHRRGAGGPGPGRPRPRRRRHRRRKPRRGAAADGTAAKKAAAGKTAAKKTGAKKATAGRGAARKRSA